jgi:glutamyl-tRNA synthetase
MTIPRTRLAPSPTGALHLGNIRTFLVTWALARREGWRIVYRLEDFDGPRVRAGSAALVAEDLRWLGMDWDEDAGKQSDDPEPYRAAMRRLAAAGAIFRSAASRREIEAAASAPHAGDHELRFPESLRPDPADAAAWAFAADGTETDVGYRLRVDPGPRTVTDRLAGPRTIDVSAEVGDFLVWTRQGVPAYQLAVVVDDARQGITDVVRGDDLLPSAARQELVHRHLGTPAPRWWHVPLVVGPDGRRLAKRHGDSRVASYRASGVSPARIVGWAAATCGVPGPRRPLTAAAFLEAFDPGALPRDPIVFTEEGHRWLLDG